VPHRHPFLTQVEGVAGGTGVDRLTWPPAGAVSRGREYHITRTLVRSEDRTITSIALEVGSPGAGMEVWRVDNPAAGYSYVEEFERVLVEGEALTAVFSGNLSGDRLILQVEGFWLEVE